MLDRKNIIVAAGSSFGRPTACFLAACFLAACFLIAWLIVAGGPIVPAAAAADKPAPVTKQPATKQPAVNTLSAKERLEVKNLLAAFSKARGKPAERDKVVEQLIAIGGPAVTQLLAAVDKELSGQSRAYGQKFQKRAVILSRGKTDKIDLAELARLRAQVLSLKDQENLAKETIVEQGDPALARLTKVLVLDRQLVLDKSPELKPVRDKLLVLGRYWEQASAALLKEESSAKPGAGDKSADAKPNDGKPSDGKPADGATGGDKPPSFEEYLQGEENLAAQMAMPMDDSTRAVLATNAALAPKIDPEEARAILACNLMRNLLGLSPLSIDLQLSAAARDHSQDMETLKFFAHESEVPGKRDPWARANNFGTTASGENIYMGSTDGNQANLAWFHSPGHFKNMFGSHARIGMGRSGGYFTELFGK